jgi:hypothetical protein
VWEGECGRNIMCSCINGKTWPVETLPGIQENDGKGEFNYDIL